MEDGEQSVEVDEGPYAQIDEESQGYPTGTGDGVSSHADVLDEYKGCDECDQGKAGYRVCGDCERMAIVKMCDGFL